MKDTFRRSYPSQYCGLTNVLDAHTVRVEQLDRSMGKGDFPGGVIILTTKGRKVIPYIYHNTGTREPLAPGTNMLRNFMTHTTDAKHMHLMHLDDAVATEVVSGDVFGRLL